jgi:uncharacterized protein involved in type VI secretion and phage assembly
VTSVVELIRKVVRAELAGRLGSRLGVVTATFPHEADDDDRNYEVDVRLKHERLDLPRVPVSVAHVGLAAPPRVDDLVLVDFLNGDPNQPLVTGRLYHADERPPMHADGEVLLEHRVPDGTRNLLRFAADGSILLQREVTKPAAAADDSAARASIHLLADGAVEIAVDEGASVLEMQGDEVTVSCRNMTIEGDLRVESHNNGTSTTISGNEITGGT